MTGPVVVNLADRGRVNLNDIPTLLRSLANDIEAGAYRPRAVIVTAVHSNEEPPRLWVWGDAAEPYRALGILQAGITRLSSVERVQ